MGVGQKKGRLATAFDLLLGINYCLSYGAFVMALASKVTRSVSPNNLPVTLAPVSTFNCVKANALPEKALPVPIIVVPTSLLYYVPGLRAMDQSNAAFRCTSGKRAPTLVQ